MKSNRNIAFLPDLSSKIGLGHLERCKKLSYEFTNNKFNSFFFFPKDKKNFVKNYSKNLNVKYFLKSDEKTILKILKKNKVEIVIFDTYKKISRTEQFIKKNNIFVISIDDHFFNHSSNLVFSNKKDLKQKFITKKDQFCYV